VAHLESHLHRSSPFQFTSLVFRMCIMGQVAIQHISKQAIQQLLTLPM